MGVLDNHPARNRRDAAQYPSIAFGFDEDDIASGHCVKCGRACTPLWHCCAPCRKRSRLAIGKTDLRLPRSFAQDNRHAPFGVTSAQIGPGQPLRPTRPRIKRFDWPRPTTTTIIANEAVAQRIFGVALNLRIKRSANPQAAIINAERIAPAFGRFAEFLDQFTTDFFKEITARQIIGAGDAGNDAKRACHCGFIIGAINEIIFEHFLEDEGSPGQCPIGIFGTAISFRRFGQNREKRHFGNAQFADILSEIGARGGLNPKTVAAKRNLIEV